MFFQNTEYRISSQTVPQFHWGWVLALFDDLDEARCQQTRRSSFLAYRDCSGARPSFQGYFDLQMQFEQFPHRRLGFNYMYSTFGTE